MRIAALQCNFNEDSLKIIDLWKKSGFNTEQLFHPIADLYSAIYDPARHRKILADYAAKAHQRGLKLILYLNVHILGPSLTNRRNEWSQRDEKGGVTFLYEGTYPSICLNSPWRHYFFKVLESLREVEIDGLFLDGPYVVEGGCRCRHCRRLRKNRPVWDFSNWTRDNFLNEAYRYWHAIKPDAPFYMNLPIFHAARSYADIPSSLKYNDIVGSEGGFMHYAPAKNAFLWKPSFTAKLLEALSPDKPRVVFMAADHKPWSFWPHTPAETALCIASCIANGSNIWYGLHGDSSLMRTPSGKSATKILTFLKKNENCQAGTASMARAGLVYSYITDRYYSAAGDESDFTSKKVEKGCFGNAESSLRGYFSLLTESQIPFDMVTDLAPDARQWRKYKVLVLPGLGALDDAMVEALKTYVSNGGTLIAEFDASLYDGTGKKRPDLALSKVFGVSTSGGYLRHSNWNYFRHSSTLLPLPLSTIGIRAGSKAVVLAERQSDMAGRYVRLGKPAGPFLVRNTYGKGVCYYFSGNFGEMHHEYHPAEYRALIDSMVRKAGASDIAFENAPSHLEVTVRKNGPGRFIHLVNYASGPSRPIERLVPVHDLKIRLSGALKCRTLSSRRLGKRLGMAGRTFVLPLLEDYDILECG